MRVTPSWAPAFCLLSMVAAAGAFASNAPVSEIMDTEIPNIAGNDPAHGVTKMAECDANVNWNLRLGLGGACQQFWPTITATPVGLRCVVSSAPSDTSFQLEGRLYTDNGWGQPGDELARTDIVTVRAPQWPSTKNVALRLRHAPLLTTDTSYVLYWQAPSGLCYLDGSNTGYLNGSNTGYLFRPCRGQGLFSHCNHPHACTPFPENIQANFTLVGVTP